MQIFGLHKNIYKIANYSLQQEIRDESIVLRQKVFRDWELLKSRGVPITEISRITGISRATYYRRKKLVQLYGLKGFLDRSKRPHNVRQSKIPKLVINLILSLRRANPTYGKSKLAVILKRDHAVSISESSVGRILSSLIKAGKISKYNRSRYSKKRRKFKSHAQKWRYGMRATSPGELVQIDHMSVTKNTLSFKHFQAWDPTTKVIIADISSNAKSLTAAKFLRKLIKELPFKLKSIQVDGGSEFMKDFEAECEELNIPLYVLPPKRPQFNGGVERGNRTFREEFYARGDLLADSIGAFRYELKKAVSKYNSYRPHFNLNGLTPFEFYNNLILAA